VVRGYSGGAEIKDAFSAWNLAGVDTAFRRQKFYKVTSGKSIRSLTVMAF